MKDEQKNAQLVDDVEKRKLSLSDIWSGFWWKDMLRCCFYAVIVFVCIYCISHFVSTSRQDAYADKGYSYETAVNEDDHLQFSMTAANISADYRKDIQVDIAGNLLESYQLAEDSTFQNEGVIRSKDGSVIIYLEYGPNVSENGNVGFYDVVVPFTAKNYVKNMPVNREGEDYTDVYGRYITYPSFWYFFDSNKSGDDGIGYLVVTKSGEYVDYAEDCSEVRQINGCIDLANGMHLGVRVYNRIPLDEYENQTAGFSLNEDIVETLASSIRFTNRSE